MPLVRLELENFRSHRAFVAELGPQTILVGPNGAGKTNILEALWALATTRSFRALHDADMIHWAAPAAWVRGDGYELRLVREPSLKKVMVAHGVVQRPLEYLGQLRAVLFTPESLAVLTGPPAGRRRFLDTLLAQSSRAAARELAWYRQILGQRNALLRLIHEGRAGQEELTVWNEQLIRAGSSMTAKRQDLLASLAALTNQSHSRLAGLPQELVFRYFATGSPEPAEFAERLYRASSREAAFQATLVGPHRDDFVIESRGRPVGSVGSRGEIRTVVLALKWAEFTCLAERAHDEEREPPIILLDDLFSELDQAHREALEELLQTEQVVVTATELEYLPPLLAQRGQIIHLPMVVSEGVSHSSAI